MTEPLALSPSRPISVRSFRDKIAGRAAFLIAAAAAISLAVTADLTGYQLNLLMQAATYAIAVFGLVIVLGLTGQINLAQAAFFGLGAYAVALGTTDFGLGFWPSLVLGVAIAALAGAILGLASLRLGGHYLAMVTISFQTILSLTLNNWISLTHGPDGIRNIARPALFAESKPYLGFCIAMFFAAGYFVFVLKRRRLGRAMQAVRDNELAAGVTGIDTFGVKVTAFTLSAALGGLGGALFAGGFTYISPDQFTFSESVVFLTMALLGGVVSPFGAAVGTGLLILLPEWLRFLKVVYLAVYGASVILIMVFLPDGLWGLFTKARKRLAPPVQPGVDGLAPLPFASAQETADGGPLLQVKGLSKHFGGLKAVDEVDLAVRSNTVHALIGPNGSGKTTMLNVISGLYRPTGGAITFAGTDITNAPPYRRARLGLGRTFQNIRLFPGMTVLDNVITGAELPVGADAVTGEDARALALSALKFVGLADRAEREVGSLSYGHQRLVEIARALAGRPKLILLDEPGAGLNHAEKDELVSLLADMKGRGLTVLIIDHDMALVEKVADRITVLNFGRRIADGGSRDVLNNPDVIAAYLGEAWRDAA
jgi:branched-chain amino acid transport system permease protein